MTFPIQSTVTLIAQTNEIENTCLLIRNHFPLYLKKYAEQGLKCTCSLGHRTF